MQARALVEARVDAERMLLATRSALEADGDLLDAAERDEIEALMRALEAARPGDDAAAVEAATQALADGTEAFAARRMNRGIAPGPVRASNARIASAPMPTIKILPHAEYCPQGAEISAPAGTSICEALLENEINIEHACEMSCACTTCHVVVRQGYDSLGEADESEEDLLDRAWGLEPQSRLSCQAILAQQDVTVEIPKYSINHAKEKNS